MKRIMLHGKIYRAVVTEANKDYEGSIEIDSDLIDGAGMLPYEQIQIYNINNGNRFETYIIEGEGGSGVICVNGAAARLVSEGDLIIIASYVHVETEEAEGIKPKILIMDSLNRVIEKK